jgi:hypothetical protein|tara:strand:- start:4021 stop:4260 length:240 start_codon:yes stop_codon:yes gene_type:complete
MAKSIIDIKKSETDITLEFIKKHSDAFVAWEILYRAYSDQIHEVPVDELIDLAGRDVVWYHNVINNARNRIKRNMLKSR